jgi:predicted dehydrogenase
LTLRIGYIGAGNFSNRHIYPQLARHDVDLAAVCDLVEERARAAAHTYGFQSVYTDFREMCDREHLDAVFCVGRQDMQYEVGTQVLERGLPVYVQKAPAATAALTREMAEVAAREQAICHVGFNLRFSPAVAKTRELLAGTDFGKPTLMIYRYGQSVGRTWQRAILDQHVHAVDTVLYVLGDWESVQVTPMLEEGVRGYVAALRMKNGTLASLNTTSEQDPSDEFIYFEVTGRGGHCVLSHDGDLRYHRPEGDDVYLRFGTWNFQRLIDWYGYYDDVRNYLAAVRGEEPDLCPVADTIRTMELCEEIARQCYEGGVAD